LERMRRTPSRFPKDDKNVGFPIVLTRADHSFIFNDLKLLGSARFRIAPATRKSRMPEPSYWTGLKAVTPCDQLGDPDRPDPFHGKSDVRLTKIRVWLIGFKTSSPLHKVTLEHLGSELFCTPTNDIYPSDDEGAGASDPSKRPRIYHAGLQVPFNYSPE